MLLALQQMCAELSDICLLKAIDQFPSIHDAGRLLNVFDPEALFIEINPSERSLDLANEFHQHKPNLILIGYARQCDRPRRAQAAEAGVADILTVPFSTDDVRSALVNAFQARPPEILDNLVAFLPAKPGNGASFTTLHNASTLAALGHKVLVIDADRQNGVLAVRTGVAPTHSLDDALATAHELNEGTWGYRRLKTNGYDLLPTAQRPATRSFAPWSYQRLLHFLMSHYDNILVDLGGVPSDGSEAFLRQAQTVHVVTGPDEASHFLAERRREELRALRLDELRIETVEPPVREEELAAASGGLFSAFRRRVHGNRDRRA
jgi:Flp pilus assembly CpaE family ATPase